MAEDHDIYRESGPAAQVESIQAAVRRLDETTLAAPERVRDAEQGYVEGTAAHPDAVAVFDAASSEAPHAAGLVALLSNVRHVQYSIESALPGQVNDTNIARIAAALRFIDNELNAYFAESDPGHLTNACDTGLQNFHQALRRSFGYWQMGQDPARWPHVTADLDLRPERREKLTGYGGTTGPGGRGRHPAGAPECRVDRILGVGLNANSYRSHRKTESALYG
jgi:hypothetical protein